MTQLRDISTYHLLIELLHNGEGNLYADLEPIDIDIIFKELEYRSGKRARNEAKVWVEWFISTEGVGSKKEKESLKMTQRILALERFYIPKINQNNGNGEQA